MSPLRPGPLLAALTLLSSLALGQQDQTSPMPAGTPPDARFRVVSQVGDIPLRVEFRDRSIGDITSWSWDFGDGATSTDRHPTHSYLELGTYSVTLEVTGPGGSDRKRRQDLVRAQLCEVTNARENVPFPYSLGIDYVPVVGNDARGFHVIYSSKDNNGTGTPGNTVGMFVFELSDGDVLLFGAGYGNFPGPEGALFSAAYDISRLDMLLRVCLGKRPDLHRVQFVTPHAHGDHMNPWAMEELRNLGWSIDSIWFHVGDEPLVNQMNWSSLDRAAFRRVEDGVPCVDRLLEFDSPLGDLWFYVRPGHTFGALDLAIDVDGDETNRIVVRGSAPSTLCGPGNVREVIDAHGNVVLRAPAPIVNNLVPGRGTSLGGSSLTLSGNNFRAQGASRPQVLIGGIEVTDFTVVDDRTIELLSPPGPPGSTLGVRVTNRNGTSQRSDLFTFNERPLLSALSPATGSAGGGDWVTLEGNGFVAFQAGPSEVTFGGRKATDVELSSDGSLRCRTPMGSPGTRVPVTLRNANGETQELFEYEYLGLPRVQRVFPEIMTALGGAEIQVSGKDLGGPDEPTPRVWFGALEALEVTNVGPGTLIAVAPPGAPGQVVDLRVRTSLGDAVLYQALRYNPLPTLSSIMPPMGTHLGGTLVHADGSGFRDLRAGAVTVTLGGLPVSNLEVLEDDRVRFLTPPGTAGDLVALELSNVNGVARLEQAFAYDPILTLDSVSTTAGSSLGGQWIDLFGTGFVSGGTPVIRIGGSPALETVVIEDGHLRFRTPPGTAGANVAFRVNNELGIVFLPGGFRYHPRPRLTGVVPLAGSPQGGSRILLQGTGFRVNDAGPGSVLFGGVPAANLTVTSDSFLSCDAPPGTPGSRVDVTFSNDNGSDTLAQSFEYYPNPRLQAVSPSSGSSLGGTLVTLTGSGFLSNEAGPASVVIGQAEGLDVRVLSDDRITFVTPAGPPASLVGIRVVNRNGSGSLASAFRIHRRPGLVAVTPGTVSARRAAPLTLEGSGFLVDRPGATAVMVGTRPAQAVTVQTDTLLTFHLPQGVLGDMAIRVSNDNGTAGLNGVLRIEDPTPTLQSCFPINGPYTGGTRTTLKGRGIDTFDPASDFVFFGTEQATDVSVLEPGVIACSVPLGAPGKSVVVSLRLRDGSAQLVNGFRYNPEPLLSALTPDQGLASGGTPVILEGEGFFRGTPGPNVVTFGGTPATGIEVLSDTRLRCTAPPGERGEVVDVVIVNNNGRGERPMAFEYTNPPPVLTTVFPNRAPSTGGGVVRLLGNGFSGEGAEANEVFFGETPAPAVLMINDGELRCQIPPGTVGARVDVSVRNENGEARLVEAFEYFAPAPTLSLVSPGSTSSLGGETITLFGTGFFDHDPGTTSLFLGALAVTGFTVLDDTTLAFTAPPGTPSSLESLRLENANGAAELTGVLRYHGLPVLTSSSESSGPAAGGGTMILQGSGLLNDRATGTRVFFGGTEATGVSVLGDGSVDVLVPPGAPGSTVEILLTNSNGEALERLPYRYHLPPTVTTINPASGSALGLTTVSLSGAGFVTDVSGPTTVTFGGVPAGELVILDDGSLTCLAPAGTPESVVDVLVSNGNGEALGLGAFAYHPSPELFSISPDNGPPAGTGTVTITGRYFMSNMPGFPTILVGGRPARNIQVFDDETLTCRVPMGSFGPKDVLFSNRNGNAVLEGAYHYGIPAPRVDLVSPSAGTALGGTLLNVEGSGFLENNPGATVFRIGGQDALGVTVLDDDHLTCVVPSGSPGTTVDLEVSNDNGSGALAGGFAYHPAPVLASLSPAEGTALGGELVTLTGSGFLANDAGAANVSFGVRAATDVTVVSDTEITCRTPEAPGAGLADVRISNANGQAIRVDGFLAVAPAPTLTILTPARGPASGGTPVTLLGSGFLRFQPGATTVRFGQKLATAVTVSSDTTLTCTAPAGAPGSTQDLTLTNANGMATLVGAFRYHEEPRLTTVTPGIGPAAGGTRLTVTGRGFLDEDPGPVQLTFGSAPGLAVTVQSDTTLQVTAPAGVAGSAVDLLLETNNGEVVITEGFRYYDAPVLTSLTPNEAPPQGGAEVTVLGSGFLVGVEGPTTVRIGSAEATAVNVVDDTTLTAIAPPVPGVGPLDVAVENSNGADTLPAAFRYRRAPQLTSVNPPSGTGLGGTTLTLSGSGFSEESVSGLEVTLDGIPATAITVLGDNQIRCVSPAAAVPGSVEVRLTTENGSATLLQGYRYHVPPVLADFTPDQASTVSGGTVTILGSGFANDVTGPTTVLFGTDPALSVQVIDDTRIVAEAPPRGSAGSVNVQVENENGSDELTGAFTYHAGPVVVSLSPSSGPPNVRTRVNISGSGFATGSAGFPAIQIGTRPARNIVVLDDNNIRCDANFGTEGPADVIVVNGNGSFTLVAGFYYGDPAPELNGVTPDSGPPETLVTLSGKGFLAPSAGTHLVQFGALTASEVTVVNDVTLTCLAPAGTPGARVNVRVTNGLGTDTRNNAFTFLAAPGITAVEPSRGSAAGGTSVLVKGHGFSTLGSPTLTFGGIPAQGVRVLDDRTLLCRTPGSAPSREVDVRLRQGAVTARLGRAFRYDDPPRLLSLSRTEGNPLGGEVVELRLEGLGSGVPEVSFGALRARILSRAAGRLSVRTPAGPAGERVSVTVASADGTTNALHFDFRPAPRILGVEPPYADSRGGARVKLNGHGFGDPEGVPPRVLVDGQPAIPEAATRTGELFVTLPPGTNGLPARLRLETADGHHESLGLLTWRDDVPDDVNGDGLSDLVEERTLDGLRALAVTLARPGTTAMTEPADPAVAPDLWFLVGAAGAAGPLTHRVVDLNGDWIPDVLVGSPTYGDGWVALFEGPFPSTPAARVLPPFEFPAPLDGDPRGFGAEFGAGGGRGQSVEITATTRGDGEEPLFYVLAREGELYILRRRAERVLRDPRGDGPTDVGASTVR